MSHDDVRLLLADHALGTLSADDEAKVDAHLRGCGSCRSEAAALATGAGALVLTAPSDDPPNDLRPLVMEAVKQEWAAPDTDSAQGRGQHDRRRWLLPVVAAVIALLGIGWGVQANMEASERQEAAAASEAKAERYEQFLGVLGGENVRVGSLVPSAEVDIHGSVVIYDSKVGQNWVLGLAQAPGLEGEATLVLRADDRSIKLHPMEFGRGGEASAWLVTSSNLRAFDVFELRDEKGRVLATGELS